MLIAFIVMVILFCLWIYQYHYDPLPDNLIIGFIGEHTNEKQ